MGLVIVQERLKISNFSHVVIAKKAFSGENKRYIIICLYDSCNMQANKDFLRKIINI